MKVTNVPGRKTMLPQSSQLILLGVNQSIPLLCLKQFNGFLLPTQTPAPGKKNTWQPTRKSKILALDCSPTWFSSSFASSPILSSLKSSVPGVSVGSVQSLSCVWLFASPWTPGFSDHHQLPELAQTQVHRVGDVINHLVLCNPLLLLPSILPRIRVFSYESVLHIRWPKYWSFSFSISPLSEYSGLISFRID